MKSFKEIYSMKGFSQRVLQFSLIMLIVSAAYLVGNISTTSASAISSKMDAHQAIAGKASSISGYGKGTASPVQLSPGELAQREAMLQKVHLPLAGIPSTPSSISHSASVAPTQVQSFLGQGHPLAPAFAVLHDLGVHSSSQVDEPSIATNGSNILETWNWYSGISTNGGASWTYYNPKTLFPNSYGGWCCDSVATYNASHDIYIWNLLYLRNTNGGAFRLAVANGASGLARASFHYWDLTPQQTGGSTGDWYDYPVISQSNNYAYLQSNVFNASQQFLRTVVMRFALNALAGTGGLSYSYFNPAGVASITFTNGATTTMYLAGHLSSSTLRLFSWAETSGTIFYYSIGHVSYPTGSFSCPRTGVANSNWCGRADSRPLGGWVSNGIIGFSWNAPQGQWGFTGSAPYPYTDIVRINESTKTHIDDPVVWNSGYAFMYMNFYPNTAGGVGGTFLYGGGSLFETAGDNIWDTQGRNFYGVVGSNRDATVAGDYLTTRPLGTQWAGTLYAMLANGVHPYYVTFGR